LRILREFIRFADPLAKMLSGVNALETSHIQKEKTDAG
jgi:hypothetical protein